MKKIILNNQEYEVDSTKLTTLTNDFISHLGTITGSGTKIVVNGVEYEVDSTKLVSAMSELEDVLKALDSGEKPESTLKTFKFRPLEYGDVTLTYEFEEWMTWEDFINSEYNTGDDFKIKNGSNYVYFDDTTTDTNIVYVYEYDSYAKLDRKIDSYNLDEDYAFYSNVQV